MANQTSNNGPSGLNEKKEFDDTMPTHHSAETISKHAELDEIDVNERLTTELAGNSREDSIDDGSASNPNIVKWSKHDPDNPYNWPMSRKLLVMTSSVATVMNSTMGSSITAGASVQLREHFHVASQAQLVLPTSIYLVGYVLGPTFFGPVSETYGRKWVSVAAFAIYTLFTMACALAPNWPALIIFRLIVGIAASCPITVVGGACADLYKDPKARGRAMSVFIAATTFGPVFGPIISGFIAVVSWRWVFWANLIFAGVSWIPLALAPESFGPVLLKWRAQRLRKKTGNPSYTAPIELEKKDIKHIVTVVLTRPVRMICFEAIVLFSCLYLSLIYGIFYLFFQAFPIIFQGIYRFNAGETGLAFIPIGVGAALTIPMYLYWDNLLYAARARNAQWCQKEEMRRLPLACFGGPLLVASMFWMAWSSRTDVHWIVPVLSGGLFGIGFLLIFMGLLNYLVDAYEIFAASAMGAASAARSIFGAVLPFAARPMYNRLGVPWACSLLGFLTLAMCAIPFIFIKYGDRLRANSKFCQYLKQRKKEEEEEEEELRRHHTKDEEATVTEDGKA